MKKLMRSLTFFAVLCAYVAFLAPGGTPAVAKGELRDVTGSVAVGAPMSSPRAGHSATLLPDGRVLIAGGMLRERAILDSAEIFDPATGSFSPINSMNEARVSHMATLLADGRVLIAGGYGQGRLRSAEIFDPATGQFTPVGDMTVPREGAAAVLLDDGRVLITGGATGQQGVAAELYDPVRETFSATGTLNEERLGHTATRLQDGKVLVVGGDAVGEDRVLTSAEIYDPRTGLFSPTADLAHPRRMHGAALLPDGRVLVIGGSDARDWEGRYTSSEIFDPRRSAFVPGPALDVPRFKIGVGVAVLNNGQIFVAGDGNHAALYSLAHQRFYLARGLIGERYLNMTATPLKDGRVLMVGGYNPDIQATAQTWLFTPDPVDE